MVKNDNQEKLPKHQTTDRSPGSSLQNPYGTTSESTPNQGVDAEIDRTATSETKFGFRNQHGSANISCTEKLFSLI